MPVAATLGVGQEIHVRFPRGAFSVLSLPSLVIWLDPSQSATVTTGVGGISQINDLSGGNNHFAQATTTIRPDYTGTLNGLNVMTFVQANLDALDCVNSFAYGPSITVAAVCKITGAVDTVNSNGVFTTDNTGGGQRNLQHRWIGATAPQSVGFVAGAPQVAQGAGTANITTGHHVDVSTIDNAAHTITRYVDSVVDGQLTGLGALTGATLNSRVGQAAIGAGGNTSWNGPIGELVVCNAALTATQRQPLEAYLKVKWGTP